MQEVFLLLWLLSVHMHFVCEVVSDVIITCYQKLSVNYAKYTITKCADDSEKYKYAISFPYYYMIYKCRAQKISR